MTKKLLLTEFEIIALANRLPVWLVLDFPDKAEAVIVDGTCVDCKATIKKWLKRGAQVAGYVAVRNSGQLESESLPNKEKSVKAAFRVLADNDGSVCIAVGGEWN